MAEPVQVRDLAPYRGTASVVSAGEAEPEERALPLSHYLWVLKWHRWKIIAFVATALTATYIVSKRLTPLYEATTTIDVDRQMPRGAMGDSTASPIISPVDADQFLATQANLIKSDSVLRPVVEKFRLREISPSRTGVARAAELRNAPVVLPGLDVTRPPNTYLLQVKYRSLDPRLASAVVNAIADSYIEHMYRIRTESLEKLGTYMTGQLTQLKAKMESSSQKLVDFERELNVINPDQKTSIQSASLLQLNTDYNTVKGERVRKEAAYNAIKSGSLSAAWTSTQGESLRKLTESLDEARQKLAQAKLHYGEKHPEYVRAQAQVVELRSQIDETKSSIGERIAIEYQQALDRENMLHDQVAETRTEFDRLNARSFDYQTLKEEAESDKKLYNELVRKIRESAISASFQDSSIRIADQARPPANPVFPRTTLNMLLALVLSCSLAMGAVIANDLVDNTIRDPDEVSRSLRVEIVGTLPAVTGLRGRITPLLPQGKPDELPHAVRTVPMSGYEEAVRTLRNSMLLTDFNCRLRSVLVTSASPSEGKSTVAAHLAAAHAEQRNKTLLIDADLRRPSVHRFFNLPNDKGLSSVLFGSMSWRDSVTEAATFAELHIISAGPASRRAADLIGRSLPQIIQEASQEYDLIILDSPPLIGFPEPLQMAASVDGVLVVTRAGHTNRRGVSSVLSMLGRLRSNIVGVVLNEVTPDMSDSYHYHDYYSRYYRLEEDNAA
jgi:succinoglycan biosynthesis transport protein ExoP